MLLASVRNVTYPITIDIFHQLFSRFGQGILPRAWPHPSFNARRCSPLVLRIWTFTKQDKLQALVEMATADQAREAQAKLDQQEIYAGCCFLTVTFSNYETVTLKGDNSRGR